MAIGFLADGVQRIPDKSMMRQTTPRVRTVSFGDGYEQRIQDGINSSEETYNTSFVNRTKAEIDAISDYFDTLKGVTAFNFTFPDTGDTETTIKVVVSDYQKTYLYDDFYSLTATLKRVYEP